MDDSAVATIFWRDAGIHSASDSHTMHYGDSLAIECTSVVHLFLLCIVGFNECTRDNPLRFRTPLTMAVRIGSYFGYSLEKIYHTPIRAFDDKRAKVSSFRFETMYPQRPEGRGRGHQRRGGERSVGRNEKR